MHLNHMRLQVALDTSLTKGHAEICEVDDWEAWVCRSGAAYLFLRDRLHDGSEGRDGGNSDRAEEQSVPTQVSQSLVRTANVQNRTLTLSSAGALELLATQTDNVCVFPSYFLL